MKFAVNFSNPLLRLLEARAVEMDLIKCPDWEGMLQEAQPYGPITIHYDLEAGLGNTFNVNFSRLKRLKKQTSTPHVNTHLVTPRYFDPDQPGEIRHINQLWRDEIQTMIEHLGAESVALEHYPYTLTTPFLRPSVDSKIFSQVITDTNCMFLLDLAHARITAHTLGVNVKDYIQSLPTDRLVEMHITGIKPFGGVLTDHFELDETDWSLLDWALKQIRSGEWRKPAVVAFEYGGVGNNFVWRTDINVLQTQVPRLYEMVHA